jgi:tRNA (guanosine-2'-O-)-methyltransferase
MNSSPISKTLSREELIERFGDKLTERRRYLIEKVLATRTRQFAMVCEDFYDPHNISAVMRTSEVFGLQDVYVVEEINPYKMKNAVLKGSFKWLNTYRFRERQACMDTLRSKGYQIAVASTNTDNNLTDLDLSKPTAFYLGAEYKGNHPDTLAQADLEFKLPQYGMTESMNVSVAAGVLMTYLDIWLQKEGRDRYTLSEADKQALRLDWYERCIFGTQMNSPMEFVEE